MFGIARNRHIRETEEVIENDAELRAQFLFVLLLELLLRRRQVWTYRIVNEIQQKIATGLTIAEFVQTLQSADTQLEGAFAALPVDVFFGVTGE